MYGDFIYGRVSLKYGAYPEVCRSVVHAVLTTLPEQQLRQAVANPAYLEGEIAAAFARIWADNSKPRADGTSSGSGSVLAAEVTAMKQRVGASQPYVQQGPGPAWAAPYSPFQRR